MKTKQVGIGKARINLKNNLYYVNGYYAWDITFSKTSTLMFDNLTRIYLTEISEEKAEQELKRIKYNFESLGIHDEDEVAVLFNDKSGQILAIAALGQNIWIDTRKKFEIKTFKGLNVVVTGLKVF